MKLKHLENMKHWNTTLQNEFPEYMYTHHRDDKTGSKKYISNYRMPVDIFENKRKYSKLLHGSEYYPLDVNSLSCTDMVIVKKPKSEGGNGHFITKVEDLKDTDIERCDIQQLIHPLLIDGHKFHLRILMGYTCTNIYLPWQFALVLVNPHKYIRGDMTTELTNTCQNGTENIWDTSAFVEVLKEKNMYDGFIKDIEQLKEYLKTRYCNLCKNNQFDIHGLDLIISENGKPFIMETNPYWYSGKDHGWENKIKMFKTIMTSITIV
tara:strand:- start:753 stop:1547 length:795 start_codon:yes stop_codon:yes gene_type:complete